MVNIRRVRNSHAARRLHASVSYRTGLIADQNLHRGNRELRVFVPVTLTLIRWPSDMNLTCNLSEDIPADQTWTFYENELSMLSSFWVGGYILTDRQTDEQTDTHRQMSPNTLPRLTDLYLIIPILCVRLARDWSKPPSVNLQRHMRGRRLNDDVGLWSFINNNNVLTHEQTNLFPAKERLTLSYALYIIILIN